MSCGCSNTTPTVTTTNCGSCGYNCSNCTCPTNPIIEPAVVCSDPEPCSELFPLECIIYSGEDITCTGTAGTLYPNVIHYVVLKNSNTIGRNFVSILNNINEQLCYLFSKDYISQFLTNIQNDETLSALFCNIVSSCDCTCTITCATVNTAVYNSSASPDTIDVNFTQVIGGTEKTFTGSITGTALSISSNPGSIVFAAGQKITGTNVNPNTFIVSGAGSSWTLSQPSNVSSQSLKATYVTYIVSIYEYINGNFYYLNDNTNDNTSILFPSNITATTSVIVTGSGHDDTTPWLVSVEATDQFASTTCKSGYYNDNSGIAVPVEDYNGCGFKMIEAAPPKPACDSICINKCESSQNPLCKTHWGVNLNTGYLTFSFTHEPPASFPFTVTSYTVHWYKRVSGSNPSDYIYVMQNPDNQETVNVTNQSGPETFTIDTSATTGPIGPGSVSFNQWLFLITPNVSSDCYGGYFDVRSETGSVYKGSDFLNLDCNWFIY